jgi:hypothetical protein
MMIGDYKDAAPLALANLPEYRNLHQCVQLVNEVADEHKIKRGTFKTARRWGCGGAFALT